MPDIPISMYWLLTEMLKAIFLSARLPICQTSHYLNKSISFNFFGQNKHILNCLRRVIYLSSYNIICSITNKLYVKLMLSVKSSKSYVPTYT